MCLRPWAAVNRLTTLLYNVEWSLSGLHFICGRWYGLWRGSSDYNNAPAKHTLVLSSVLLLLIGCTWLFERASFLSSLCSVPLLFYNIRYGSLILSHTDRETEIETSDSCFGE